MADCAACRPRIAGKDALVPEQLVPIRLEFDVEHHKMRDTFVWNLNGTSPRSLSLLFCTPAFSRLHFNLPVIQIRSSPRKSSHNPSSTTTLSRLLTTLSSPRPSKINSPTTKRIPRRSAGTQILPPRSRSPNRFWTTRTRSWPVRWTTKKRSGGRRGGSM